MTKKTLSPRKEVANQRRAELLEKLAPPVLKLVAGTAIVIFSYSSIYRVVLDSIQEHPEYFAAGIAASAITSLVCVLAYFDTKK